MITYHDIQVTEADDVDEPVSISDVKAWCNVDSDDDNAIIWNMMIGARQDIENLTNLALVSKTVVMYYDSTRCSDRVMLPYGTHSSLSIVSLNGSEETAITAGIGYTVRGNSILPLIAGSFKASYTVGNNVPQALKESIMMLVSYRYNNRGDGEKQQGIPADIIARIAKYKTVWL